MLLPITVHNASAAVLSSQKKQANMSVVHLRTRPHSLCLQWKMTATVLLGNAAGERCARLYKAVSRL